MKILVLSDSHGKFDFMRRCIYKVKPDHVIHLGDHIDDGKVLEGENPHIRFHMVPGNCDTFRFYGIVPEVLCYPIDGVVLYMTHGHQHRVKTDYSGVIAQARSKNAGAVLFGHTHIPFCRQESDGIWVVNPGSCRDTHTAALIETADGKISACCILKQTDIDEL